MLEKPDIPDESIIACLQDEYGLQAAEIAFLPLGADVNTAVYRALADDGTPYFVKLRSGVFDETSVALPRFLSDQGIAQIIAPLATTAGQLWATLDDFKVILYPFVEGSDVYEVNLTERQWADLGAALRRIHTLTLPPALAGRVARETYTARWREAVKAFQERVEQDTFEEPVAARTAALMKDKRAVIGNLVARAGRLAQALEARTLEFVLCHSDIHAGNIHVAPDGALYIVDWDNPILAPKERDLMHAGGGLMGRWRSPEEEEALFYAGYGEAEVDAIALAYYRYERVVQDIAAFCEQLLATDEGGEDREVSYGYLASNFLPGHVLEIACRAGATGFRPACGSTTSGFAA